MVVATTAKTWAWLLSVCAMALAADQAAPPKPKFWDRATIEQADGTVSVRANSSRPLEQAIEAIRQEYGWTVDYEEPPYESYDLVDNTDPGWRGAHPTAKGVTRIAGGLFTATFYAGSDMSSGSPDEERALEKVVADYNASGNPGRFMLKAEGADRLSIVGIGIRDSSGNERTVTPILDTRISLPLQEHDVVEAMKLISQAVSEKSPYKVEPGNAPTNLSIQTRMRVGGDNLTARELFAQVAAATRLRTIWLLLWDADAHCYFMNMDIAMEATSHDPSSPGLKPIPKH
jgi:hypothetical protein